MFVMITRKTLLWTFFVVKMNTQRVKKKKGVSYIKILNNETRIWSYCSECATAVSRATAAEKETALGLDVGSYTNTFAPRCSLKAWVSRLGSPPLCFACRRPLGRSGILVLTCTGLSVSPRASLSSPALPPAPRPRARLAFRPLARRLIVFPFLLLCAPTVLFIWQGTFPVCFQSRVLMTRCNITNKKEKTLLLPVPPPVSQTGINTLASLRWKGEFCCGLLPIITSSSHSKHVFTTPMTKTVDWCWYRAVATFCNVFFF